jgi:hypothetical protein
MWSYQGWIVALVYSLDMPRTITIAICHDHHDVPWQAPWMTLEANKPGKRKLNFRKKKKKKKKLRIFFDEVHGAIHADDDSPCQHDKSRYQE